jgi:predicted ATPase
MALLRDTARAVTLTGPGGSGKTRLALQVGAELVDELPGGVFFVPLAAIAEADLVVRALESATGAGDLVDIARRKALLVIDNFEHVLEAATAVADVLAAGPGVRVLVTSRAPLRIDGEREYRVDPLPDTEAVALLVERARAVRPGFEPDEAAAQICRRLDGLPLAIELAASRLRSLGSAALLDRLDRRLPLLSGGRRDAPARQRTLRATIEWSHDLLGAELRSAFRKLGVFADAFALEAAEAIAEAGVPELDGLVEASLLKPAERDRFLMLETIREFALEQLERAGDHELRRRRHAEHFLCVAEELGLTTEAVEARYGGIAAALPDLQNFRAALDWAAASDPELGLRLAVALELLWTHSPAEGLRRLESLLARAADIPLELRAQALRNIGGASQLTGETESAMKHYERSLELYERLGLEWQVVHLRHRIAVTSCELGDWRRARRLLDENLGRANAGGWRMLEAEALMGLGSVDFHDGNVEQSVALMRRGLELSRQLALEWFETTALINLGEFELKLGRFGDAERDACAALALARRTHDRQSMVFALATLALAARAQGVDERAGLIWGAIEAEAERAPIGVWDTHYREEYEPQIVNDAGPGFERGLADGRRMTFDEAVARCLADEPLATPQ